MKMKRRTVLTGMGAAAALSAVRQMSAEIPAPSQASAAGSGTVYELRVYHANDGKLDDLLARFRNHTITIFNRHGMESVAYWTPTDDPLKGKTLFYILRHPSREAATANWAAFRADPEWQQVSTASEANGKLVQSTESTFLTLTDFSPRV
jgi:NIPSNAP